MDATEIVIGIAGIVLPSYLIHRQNQILKHANDLTAHNLGPDAPKEPINMVSLRRYWPMWGMLLMMLGTWGAVIFDYHDRHHQGAVSHWGNIELKQEWGGHYKGETISLDGIEYVNATFDGVTFRYEGSAPTRLTNVHFVPQASNALLFKLASHNPVVQQVLLLNQVLNQAAGCTQNDSMEVRPRQ
jgi:hypothetical protein